MNRSAAAATGLSIFALLPLSAAADILHFDNSAGQFEWVESFVLNGNFMHGSSLDLTQGPSQSGEQTPMSLLAYTEIFFTSNQLVNTSIEPNDPSVMRIARNPEVLIDLGPNSDIVFPVTTYALGVPIGPSVPNGSWAVSADVNYRSGAINVSLIGGRAFVGIRLQLADGIHYGWIDLLDQGYNTNPSFLPLAWAIETTPNTPIAAGVIPAPASIACLGVLSLTAGRRRRR